MPRKRHRNRHREKRPATARRGEMSRRRLVSLSVLAVLATVMSLTSMPVAGQASSAGPRAAPGSAKPSAERPWTPPRTPWGEPDLQGVGDYRTITPMERPAKFAQKESLTEAEAVELEKLDAEENVDRPPRAGDPGTYNQFGMIRERKVGGPGRWSLIADQPDEKIPVRTAAAKKRQAAIAEAQRGVGPDEPPVGGWADDLSVTVRCILGFNSGPPMHPAAYNNNVEIVQSPGYVTIHNEMNHSVRVVPTDGRPHLPSHMRLWVGDPRGRWDGATLVVDTTNFLRETSFGRFAGAFGRLGGSGPNIHLIERFRRVGPDALMYEVTVEDATTWVKPWTYTIPMRKSNEMIYEYACHEGNSSIEAILAASRTREKASGGASTKK